MSLKTAHQIKSKPSIKRNATASAKHALPVTGRALRRHKAESSFERHSVHRTNEHAATGAPRRTDPLKEWPDFLTPMGGFTQLHWDPLRIQLNEFQAGTLSKKGDGGFDDVPVDAKELRAKLNSYLQQPEVQREATTHRNIYEIEARFLEPYGVLSRNELNDLFYRGAHSYVKVNRGELPSPIYAAVKTVFDHAAKDPKYAALLAQVRRDPITAVMLFNGVDRAHCSSFAVKPHEKRLVDDLIEITYAATLFNRDGTRWHEGPSDNPGRARVQERLKWSDAAHDAMKQVADSKKATHKRLADAMTALSWKKPAFTFDDY